MTLTEFLAWLNAPDEHAAYLIWKQAYLRLHPESSCEPDYKINIYYTADLQIGNYWRSPIGQINKTLILFWFHVKRPRLKWHWYWFWWNWRSR